jgi:UDP-N-acetylglucosamine diphosphorylase/glucosamine-1-phosphate N-acetyltransferase
MKAIDISTEDNCIKLLRHPYQIFSYNGDEIKRDFELLATDRQSHSLSDTNKVVGKNPIFIEEGCQIECCTFNTQDGPIYIGKNSLIMEGSLIRGPFAMGEKSVIKMGAKIYGHTTIGPGCKVGGEVQNVVFQANSNKAHDGYLGNSVIGEWCNIGAGTDNSNLKNNYEEVKLWSYIKEGFEKTGLQFCGLIFGDHSKCAIGTTFNTGTVVGVSANIFGSGFPRNFIPSFAWGGHSGFKTYQLPKAIETAERVMERRGLKLSDVDKKILEFTFLESAKYRTWE